TLLKEQTGAIHQQAAASTIPVETLQRAFQNIYDTMDTIDTFKVKALDSMKQTVTTLSAEVEKSKGYIARAQGQSSAQVAHDGPSLLSLEGSDAILAAARASLNDQRAGGRRVPAGKPIGQRSAALRRSGQKRKALALALSIVVAIMLVNLLIGLLSG
ncbi:hypothetical protein KXW38_001017, partial [Aspergillus fumigatus]